MTQILISVMEIQLVNCIMIKYVVHSFECALYKFVHKYVHVNFCGTQEWEENATSSVSLLSELQLVRKLIVNWRTLELT